MARHGPSRQQVVAGQWAQPSQPDCVMQAATLSRLQAVLPFIQGPRGRREAVGTLWT